MLAVDNILTLKRTSLTANVLPDKNQRANNKFNVINFHIPLLSKGSSRGSLSPLPRHGMSAQLPRALSTEYKIEFEF